MLEGWIGWKPDQLTNDRRVAERRLNCLLRFRKAIVESDFFVRTSKINNTLVNLP